MPLFRIMGGPSRNGNSVSSTPSSSGRGPSVSRYTYPGQRTSASASTNPSSAHSYNNNSQVSSSVSGSLVEPPATSSSMNSVGNICSSNLIVRGSSVVSGSQASVLSTNTTPSQSALPSTPYSATGTNTSNTQTTAPDSTTSTATRPGAYQVTRTVSGPAQVYRVTVPQGVRPGAEFTVHAGPRRVRVRCPPSCQPGQSLQITLPPEPNTHYAALRQAPLTAAPTLARDNNQAADSSNGTTTNGGQHSQISSVTTGGYVSMTPEVQRVNQQAAAAGGTPQTFLVTIPPNIHPGMTFVVNVGGSNTGSPAQRFMVTCPTNAGPNQKVRIVPPPCLLESNPEPEPEPSEAAPSTQVFEVAVPPGVQAGQPFALIANGQRVLVTCPPNVSAGQKIRFQLPVSNWPTESGNKLNEIQLCYQGEKELGWMRTIRAKDLKFQWVRLDQPQQKGDDTLVLDGSKRGDGMAKHDDDEPVPGDTCVGMQPKVQADSKFDFSKSAYVRKITFLEGNDSRMRTGTVELVPANEAVVDSKLVVNGKVLLSYADIASVQGKPLEEKTEWFQRICTQLTSAWDDGHIKIVVRRKFLLQDSVDAIMSLGRDDLRKRWRIEFLGEPGLDAGGLTKEWFQLVTEKIFDPAVGLWKFSFNNQMCLDINPASALTCPEDHLVYFRFLGRVLGRAVFDRQLVKGHMTRTIYRHILGWPVTFEDIENQDEDYYKSLKKLSRMSPESIPNMCLDFTATEGDVGAFIDQELVEGGSDREVNGENLAEYLELNLKYRLMGRMKLQLTELLLGFFDIVPEPALTVFDANELELILCGLPMIDMEDWKANTLYSGCFSKCPSRDQIVMWFWEVVTDDFDTEMKARLLQFVTGTSGVPSRGFSVLQGIDGNIKKFTIHGVDMNTSSYPRAHTCFNRIDLPLYNTKAELHEKLKTTITLCGVGFDME